uniref:Aminoglycoside phosphotransferase domain-containing protein n=1 Tax=Heterosigma akashiwo TaxID=2829 RepID=A0A7S3XJ37_HETAK
MAGFISEELSPAYNDNYATIVHGDYKAMNVFLPTMTDEREDEAHPIIIDFASTGVGLGMSDVAMHITHALDPEHLVNGGEEAMVDGYLEALGEALPEGCSYPREVALRHYRLAVVDYFRFIMGRLWKGATLETFEKRKSSKNTVYVNRSVGAAVNFIERADRYLSEFEEERREKQERLLEGDFQAEEYLAAPQS